MRGIDSLICTLEEWKTLASSLGALSHVESAHGHSQMVSPHATKCWASSDGAQTVLQNEVLRNTGWIRGFQLTVQFLSIAHSTAGQIAYDLVNREHSGEGTRIVRLLYAGSFL